MNTTELDRELDRARRSGPVQQIVIPPCPELLTRLQQVMKQDDPDWQSILDIAKSDVAMSVTLIRQANGPMYRRNSTVQTVEQAFAVLGLRQSAAVLSGFLIRNALKVDPRHLEHFWDSSSQRATAMAYIARQMYSLPPDLAHTFGLFCDVGIPVMLQSLPGYAGTLVESRARIDRTAVETENACHSTDHAVVGALVSRAWGLAPAITLGIRLHHDADAMTDKQVPETVRHLICGALVAEHLLAKVQERKDTLDWVRHGGTALEALHIQEEELTLWSDALSAAFDAEATQWGGL